MGIDVFGRGTYGGGELSTHVAAAAAIREGGAAPNASFKQLTFMHPSHTYSKFANAAGFAGAEYGRVSLHCQMREENQLTGTLFLCSTGRCSIIV